MSAFVFEKVRAFGWVVHRKTLLTGQTYTAVVPDDMRPADSENITLWTRGLIAGRREDGYTTPVREPGSFSLERGVMPAGTYVFTCMEDSEWWCVNWRANRGRLPSLLPFRLAAGAERALPTGTLLLVCSGSLLTAAGSLGQGAEVEVASAVAVVRAGSEPVYGLIFEKEAPQ